MNSNRTTIYQNKVTRVFLIFLIFMAAACSGPVEIREQFKLETNFRPDTDNIMSSFTDAVNDVLIERAEKAGVDSVLQFQPNQKRRVSPYQDVTFLPLSTTEKLKMLCTEFGSIKEPCVAKIATIDFDKNFVLVVGHPVPQVMVGGEINSGGAIYFDKVVDMATTDSIRKIKLETSRLGGGSYDNFSVFSSKWQSGIYLLERKGCNKVMVELDG